MLQYRVLGIRKREAVGKYLLDLSRWGWLLGRSVHSELNQPKSSILSRSGQPLSLWGHTKSHGVARSWGLAAPSSDCQMADKRPKTLVQQLSLTLQFRRRHTPLAVGWHARSTSLP
jgi:hypothetical protein